MIDSTTNFVEHPRLVAQRICRYADIVGRERVIAGADCGFGTSGDGITAKHDRAKILGDVSQSCHGRSGRDRSEEHTSELQSRPDLVCRLLLEKKKEVVIRTASLGNAD